MSINLLDALLSLAVAIDYIIAKVCGKPVLTKERIAFYMAACIIVAIESFIKNKRKRKNNKQE